MKPKTLSAGVVVARFKDAQPRFLLLRAYGYWDFPKGEVEAGESPLAAACREVEEETGLRRLDFRWGRQYRETPPYARGKVARYYVAETPAVGKVALRPNPQTGRVEHHEFQWLHYEAARARLNPRVRAILDWARDQMAGG